MGRIFVDTVLGFYARKSRERKFVGGECGAFTVVQRVSSDLGLNPHYHSVFLDGVFAPGKDGALRDPARRAPARARRSHRRRG